MSKKRSKFWWIWSLLERINSQFNLDVFEPFRNIVHVFPTNIAFWTATVPCRAVLRLIGAQSFVKTGFLFIWTPLIISAWSIYSRLSGNVYSCVWTLLWFPVSKGKKRFLKLLNQLKKHCLLSSLLPCELNASLQRFEDCLLTDICLLLCVLLFPRFLYEWRIVSYLISYQMREQKSLTKFMQMTLLILEVEKDRDINMMKWGKCL